MKKHKVNNDGITVIDLPIIRRTWTGEMTFNIRHTIMKVRMTGYKSIFKEMKYP